MFYALAQCQPQLMGGGVESCLSDINPDLVNAYQVVRREVEPLIELLQQHAASHCRDHYYQVREQHEIADSVERAARFIYLNKTCFNGLWRVNSRGRFNVPMGSAAKPAICQAENLRACQNALQRVEINQRDFRDIQPAAGDFVYFDPPYYTEKSSGFTKYARGDFGRGEHLALRDLCLVLHERGVNFMLSNSDRSYIRALYADAPFHVETVQAPRMVNRDATGRGAVDELLIRNYA